MAFIDLYSCFASPVFNIAEAFGLAADDPRGLTVTGGLPFLAARATTTRCTRLRAWPSGCVPSPAALALSAPMVALCPSTRLASTPPPRPRGSRWIAGPSRRRSTRCRILRSPKRPIGLARIETYTVEYDRLGQPERGLLVGRLEDGSRFIANVADGDAETLARLADERTEPIGMTGHVGPGLDGRNLFRLAFPGAAAATSDAAVVSERCGAVLVVTINRPRVRNAINDQVAQGIEAALDAAEQDERSRLS